MKSVLIAHRGVPVTFPENSIAGFEAALNAGARFLETDVQVTSDGVAVLSHDPSTLKLTGSDIEITDSDYAAISSLPAGFPKRFDASYAQFRLARLEEFADLLSRWPDARAFIELKKASIENLGANKLVAVVLDNLAEVIEQCIIISFDCELLLHARTVTKAPIGWVLPEWSETTYAQAKELQPEFLFCNRKRLPQEMEHFWPGNWRWVIYTLNDAAEVKDFMRRGAHMIETDTIITLL